ncbi:MAG: dihydroneopterin aldolase [Phycisphaerae bacterium]
MVIRINDLLLESIIGVYEDEREAPQPISVHIELEYDASHAIRSDDISQAIDYDQMVQQICKEVRLTRFNLLESLADFVLRQVLAHPRVIQAAVTVEKPNALENAESVSATTIGRAVQE